MLKKQFKDMPCAIRSLLCHGLGDWNCSKFLFTQNWNLPEFEIIIIGICQNWKLSKLGFARIGICQNWKFVRIGICQNWNLSSV